MQFQEGLEDIQHLAIYERFLFKYEQLQKEKGQKISEGNFGVFNFPKKQQKNFPNF
jgi:hypothetical protein